MKSIQSSLALLIVVALFSQSTIGAPPKGSFKCSESKADSCANSLTMIGDQSFTFPETDQDLEEHCKKIKVTEKCIKNYSSKCMKAPEKETVAVIAYGISKTNRGFCGTKKQRANFIVLGKCGNPLLKTLNNYIDHMNKDFQAIVGYSDPKLRIPLACCSYYSFKQRVMSLVDKKCTSDAVSYVESLIDGYAQDALNLLCGDYTEESDKCGQIISKVPKHLKESKYKNFLIPLSKVIQSLP